MKAVKFIAISLVLVANIAWGMNVNPTLSGAWFNPNQSGHGLSVEVMDPERAILFWYVYHPDGVPMFLYIDGYINGDTISGTAYYFSGMEFGSFDPNDNERTTWGTASIRFTDCANATFNYSSNDPAYGSGTIPMSRLIAIPGIKCVNFPIQNTYHLTLTDNFDVGFGIMWVFENGYSAFYAAGDSGAVTGFGDMTQQSNNRFQFDFVHFDVVNGGWEEEIATGKYGWNTIEANFDGGKLIGTAVPNFQSAITYGFIADTYDILNAATDSTIGTLTFDANGNVDGVTFDGCTLNGGYVIPDQQFNQIYTEINVSGCATYNSLIYGAGNAAGENADIYLGLTDNYKGIIWILKK